MTTHQITADKITAGKMTTEEILKIRRENLLPSAVHTFRNPLHVTKASMQWVWDIDGKKIFRRFWRHRHHQCRS